MTARFVLALHLAIATAFVPWTLRAAPPAAASVEAFRLFTESKQRFEEGKFREAAALLKTAYAISPEPVLLYNLGRAYEGMGDLATAADAYDSYLRAEPNPPDKRAIEEQVRTLRHRVEEEQRLARERELALKLQEEHRQKYLHAVRPRPSPFPWLVGGGGVLCGAAATAFAFMSVEAQSLAERASSHRVATEQLDRARTYASAANVGWIAGAVLLVVGGMWLFFDGKRVRHGGHRTSMSFVGQF